MNILHVHDNASLAGGAEQAILRSCYEFEKLGHSASMACLFGDQESIQSRVSNCWVMSQHKRSYSGGEVKNWIRGVLEESKPNLIFINSIFDANLLDELIGELPTVRWVHDERVYCLDQSKLLPGASRDLCNKKFGIGCARCRYENIFMGRFSLNPRDLPHYFQSIRQYLDRKKSLRALRGVDCFMTHSKYTKRMLEEHGFDSNRIFCQSLPLTKGVQSISAGRIENPKRFVMTAGRLSWHKGIHLVVEALPKVEREVSLVICGSGPLEEDLRQRVESLGIEHRVHFTGWLDSKETGRYFASAELVCVPSMWPEPFGMIGPEAMSYSKPLVAFDVGGISEWLIDGENGVMARRGDVDSLANSMNMILRDESRARRMGERGKRIYEERFSSAGLGSSMERIIERAIKYRGSVK